MITCSTLCLLNRRICFFYHLSKKYDEMIEDFIVYFFQAERYCKSNRPDGVMYVWSVSLL